MLLNVLSPFSCVEPVAVLSFTSVVSGEAFTPCLLSPD